VDDGVPCAVHSVDIVNDSNITSGSLHGELATRDGKYLFETIRETKYIRIEWIIIYSVTEYRLLVNIETYSTDHLNPVLYFILRKIRRIS